MKAIPLRNLLHFAVAFGAAALLFIGCATKSNSEPSPDSGADAEIVDSGSGADGATPDEFRQDDAGPDGGGVSDEKGGVDGQPTGCKPAPASGTFWALAATDRDTGKAAPLCKYRGKVVLIVNIAAL